MIGDDDEEIGTEKQAEQQPAEKAEDAGDEGDSNEENAEADTDTEDGLTEDSGSGGQ